MENRTILESLRRSRAVTHGREVAVLVRLFVLFLFSSLFYFAVQTGIIFIANFSSHVFISDLYFFLVYSVGSVVAASLVLPLAVSYLYVMYQDLNANFGNVQTQPLQENLPPQQAITDSRSVFKVLGLVYLIAVPASGFMAIMSVMLFDDPYMTATETIFSTIVAIGWWLGPLVMLGSALILLWCGFTQTTPSRTALGKKVMIVPMVWLGITLGLVLIPFSVIDMLF